MNDRLDQMNDDAFAHVVDTALLLGRSDCHGANVAAAPGPRFKCVQCLDDCAVTLNGEVMLTRFGGPR
jgi:hypothetical protein